ncbi:MAG: phenylalanine--tRNA ligase beta subunit [Bacteroidia bacterium]|nr:MAG: phenylalanine--tRNA ligase beta subunit [Bacteroidia bacterium]
MKVSYQLLKQLLPIQLHPQEIADILTEIGLEVESISEYISHKGLENVVVGEVLEKTKHPNADKLSLTKVLIGNEKVLSIVCGAPNVDVHQKVLVALVGAKLHTFKGEIIEIKKSKIRGEVSEGMICAEDELGLSDNHNGIMVLPSDVPVGLPAADYFKVTKDYIFEIGLTANRGDAASHIGIARDLKAYLKTHYADEYADLTLNFPASLDFPESSGTIDIDIEIQNTEDCKRYAGIVINGVKVAPSPQWLQNTLNALGIRPINNIVDITNYVMLELGQPLHAFDVRAIKGNKIVVCNVPQGTEFVTLDGIKRQLSSHDLMICNAEEPMCIAGVFGGLNSGIKDDTQTIFLESAWFNPTSIRRTSTTLGLKTDASFRFERFTDPEMVIYALNRACSLILEIAGGSLSMSVKDIYPQPFEPYKVGYSIRHANELFGQEIPFETTKKIIEQLEIQIESESHEGMLLLVPPRKSDVTREVDVAEEVLRIYGYNNIHTKKKFSFQIPEYSNYNQSLWVQFTHKLSEYLVDKGFYETQGLSFHHHSFYPENIQNKLIKIKNPVNVELDALRNTLLFNALQTIIFNERHQQKNFLGFEIGKIYWYEDNTPQEEYRLSIFSSGKTPLTESFYNSNKEFYFIKEIIENIFNFCNTSLQIKENSQYPFIRSITYFTDKQQELASLGFVDPSVLKPFEIENYPVIYSELRLPIIFDNYKTKQTTYKEIIKFPIVERDLSLLLDHSISFSEIKKCVQQSAKPYLKDIKIFDYYQGKNIPENKKSYAIRLLLQDNSRTLTDKEIDTIMNKTIQELKKQLNAELR